MPKHIDITGQKFGKLLVLEEMKTPVISKQKYRKYLLKVKCKCDCGNILTPFKGNVLHGKTSQCRYCQNSKVTLGEKRGALTVLSRVNENGVRKYACKCDCGFEDIYVPRFLHRGKKICCKKCKFPKRYTPKIPKKTVKESLTETNYKKHIKSKTNLIGKKNGLLSVLGFSHWEEKHNRRRSYYKAKCKCGNEVVVRDVFSVKSCGCLQKKSAKKGEDRHNSRLTNKQADAIREFNKSNLGYTGRQLADIFGVNEAIISNVLCEKTYKN